jgi:hypothetical protein
VALELASRKHGLDTLTDGEARQPAQRKPSTAQTTSGPEPATQRPLPDATKLLQSRGDRDHAPTQMAIHLIKENIPSGAHHTGPTTSRDIRTARADGKTAAQDEWP